MLIQGFLGFVIAVVTGAVLVASGIGLWRHDGCGPGVRSSVSTDTRPGGCGVTTGPHPRACNDPLPRRYGS
jgi:hypothetical protein